MDQIKIFETVVRDVASGDADLKAMQDRVNRWATRHEVKQITTSIAVGDLGAMIYTITALCKVRVNSQGDVLESLDDE